MKTFDVLMGSPDNPIIVPVTGQWWEVDNSSGIFIIHGEDNDEDLFACPLSRLVYVQVRQ